MYICTRIETTYKLDQISIDFTYVVSNNMLLLHKVNALISEKFAITQRDRFSQLFASVIQIMIDFGFFIVKPSLDI